MSPNAGGGGSCGGLILMSTAVHRSSKKLWRSNSTSFLTIGLVITKNPEYCDVTMVCISFFSAIFSGFFFQHGLQIVVLYLYRIKYNIFIDLLSGRPRIRGDRGHSGQPF
jgi:hypothetical protein